MEPFYTEEQNLIQPAPNWRTEDGSDAPPSHDTDVLHHAPLIENQEADTLWYSQYFVNKEHQNYLGMDENIGPYALSILREDNQVRAILWRNEGPAPMCFKVKPKENLGPGDVLRLIDPNVSKKKLREVKSSSLQDELFKLEEKTAMRNRFYKFGVVYARAGQKTEEDFFGNRHGSDEFNRFLSALGDKVALKNWEGFNAGLDTRFDRTGKYSIYTKYLDYEIMFHVSTMLPHTEGDPQQVDKKRHIGNDVVVIVFQEHDSHEKFSPLSISARFPHLYAVVRPVDSLGTAHRVSFAIKDSLKPFGPPLPNPHVFDDLQHLKNFLLVKLINGEREAYRSAPDFRTSDVLRSFLREIHEKFPKSLISRQASKTDLKEEMRDAGVESSGPSTSPGPLVSRTVSPSTMAFQTKNICSKQLEITCSDTWGNLMVVGTSSGLYLFDPLRPPGDQWYRVHTHSSDKYFAYKRLDVIDSCGILLTLMPKVGIVIYDLGSLMDEAGPNELKLDKTKNAAMYAMSDHLALCVAVKSELLLFRWDEDRFIPTHALQLSQPPRSIMYWRHVLVVGLDGGFELINPDPENASSQLLFPSVSKESRPLDAVVLNEELLLCFTTVGIFVNIDGIRTRSFDVKWNTVPSSFVYIYPYLLVFSPISIEVRTLVNGNLVQTINPDEGMQNLHLLTTSQGIFYASRADNGSHSSIHQLKLGAPLAAAKKAAARRTQSHNSLLSLSPGGNSPPLSRMTGQLPPSRQMALAVDQTPFNYRSMENSEDAAEDGSRPSPRSSTSSNSRSSSPRDAERFFRGGESKFRLPLHQKTPSDSTTPPGTPPANAKQLFPIMENRSTESTPTGSPRKEEGRASARKRRPRPLSVQSSEGTDSSPAISISQASEEADGSASSNASPAPRVRSSKRHRLHQSGGAESYEATEAIHINGGSPAGTHGDGASQRSSVSMPSGGTPPNVPRLKSFFGSGVTEKPPKSPKSPKSSKSPRSKRKDADVDRRPTPTRRNTELALSPTSARAADSSPMRSPRSSTNLSVASPASPAKSPRSSKKSLAASTDALNEPSGSGESTPKAEGSPVSPRISKKRSKMLPILGDGAEKKDS